MKQPSVLLFELNSLTLMDFYFGFVGKFLINGKFHR